MTRLWRYYIVWFFIFIGFIMINLLSSKYFLYSTNNYINNSILKSRKLKQIVAIACFVLSGLALCYLFYRNCVQSKKSGGSGEIENPKKIENIKNENNNILLPIQPTEIEGLIKQIDQLIEEGKTDQLELDKIESLIKTALEIDHHNLSVLTRYAKFLSSHDRFVEAQHQYEEALKISPKDTGILMDYAFILDYQGQWSQAILVLEDILKLDPTHVSALLTSAEILKDLKEWDKSQKKYEQALKFKPTDFAILKDYAAILRIQGKFDQAMLELEKILASDPTHQDALLNYKENAISIKQYKKAQEKYKKALKIAPENIEFLNSYSHLFYLREKYDKAITICKQVLGKDSNNILALKFYAWNLRKLDKWELAQEKYEEILKIDPNHIFILYEYGCFLVERHLLQKAIEQFHKAHTLAPQDKFLYNALSHTQVTFEKEMALKKQMEDQLQMQQQVQGALSDALSILLFGRILILIEKCKKKEEQLINYLKTNPHSVLYKKRLEDISTIIKKLETAIKCLENNGHPKEISEQTKQEIQAEYQKMLKLAELEGISVS